MAAYRAHWQEVEKAYAKNSIEGTDIKKTSVGPARLAIEKSVKSARENGQAVKGSPGLSNLTVTKADLNRDVPKVHLSSCLDVSEWVIYNESTGEPVPQPSDRLTKYTVTSLLEKWPDGWVVTKDEPHQGTQKPSHLGDSVFCESWWGSLSGWCRTSCGSCSSGWCRRRRRGRR
ncbi:hypothetical protein M3398_29455, partial [Streptomyces albidoflavus]|nr:hypothetical protein [Streptomyces albidoflavus]